jgi:hypothetical protein
VIAFYDASDKHHLVLDASKYVFNKSTGTKGKIELRVCGGGVAKNIIVFKNKEDRKNMIKQLGWFAKHGDSSYAKLLIKKTYSWWLDPNLV